MFWWFQTIRYDSRSSLDTFWLIFKSVMTQWWHDDIMMTQIKDFSKSSKFVRNDFKTVGSAIKSHNITQFSSKFIDLGGLDRLKPQYWHSLKIQYKIKKCVIKKGKMKNLFAFRFKSSSYHIIYMPAKFYVAIYFRSRDMTHVTIFMTSEYPRITGTCNKMWQN